MTIVNRSMYPLQQSFSTISKMNAQLEQLQVQLGTGKRQQDLASYGTSRSLDLQVRDRLGRIEGYSQNISNVTLRLDMLDKVMGRLDKLESEARSSAIAGGYGADDINLTNMPTLSKGRLDELVTLLNSNVAGRYLFGGSVTDRAPVATMSALLDGEGGRAGFRTVVSERRLADSGTDGIGRLDLSRVGPAVTLAEDGAHPFGLKLSVLSTTSAGIALTQPTGSPQSLAIEVTGPVTAGQTVTVGLTLPDGTATAVTLKAVTGTPAATGEFQIGADADTTATNLQAALQASLERVGDTELVASSAFAAAGNFFNGSGEAVQRVSGPPYETATTLVAATSSDTVFWYRGGDAAAPRETVNAKVDDGTAVRYGIQANEDGLVLLVRSLAAMSIDTYPSSDPTSKARYDAVSKMQSAQLSESKNSDPGSIELITLELGQAREAVGNAKDRHTAYKAQLDTMLADIESVDIEEVAMQLLALKTRLEASYTTTSAMNQLSLVNYLR